MSNAQKRLAKYTVLRHFPYPNRDECVSVGILVFLSRDTVRVHIADEGDLQKVKAMNPGADLQEILDLESGIPQFFRKMLGGHMIEPDPEQMMKMLAECSTVRPHESLCNFSYTTDDDYFSVVDRIMRSLVLPTRSGDSAWAVRS